MLTVRVTVITGRACDSKNSILPLVVRVRVTFITGMGCDSITAGSSEQRPGARGWYTGSGVMACSVRVLG